MAKSKVDTSAAAKPKFNPFAKAKAAVAAAPVEAVKKETIWVVGKAEQTPVLPEAVVKAIDEIVRLQSEIKTREVTQKAHKSVAQRYGFGRYLDAVAATGTEPPTPMKVVAPESGNQVTYVVTDRSTLTKITDDQLAALESAVGAEAAKEIVWDGGQYQFNEQTLAEPGVLEKVQEAMGEMLEKLDLTDEQKESLIVFKQQRTFRPRTIERAALICGRDKARLEAFYGAMGSAFSHYCKP